MAPTQLDRIEDMLLQLDAKLDALVQALADEDETPVLKTLDGEQAGQERDQSQSLG